MLLSSANYAQTLHIQVQKKAKQSLQQQLTKIRNLTPTQFCSYSMKKLKNPYTIQHIKSLSNIEKEKYYLDCIYNLEQLIEEYNQYIKSLTQ